MKRILFLLAFTSVSLLSAAQSHDKVYAIFVVNFAKYIKWPSEKSSGEFVIGVLGSSPIRAELETAAGLKTIGTQKIIVKEYQTVSEVTGCHLLFVTENKSTLVTDAISRLTPEATLIVTEKEGLARHGGGISFAAASGKVKFEINKGAIEKKGMMVSSALTNLGTVVED